jgi:alkanesulfonate monooxygenase SsuD/methylene tetrahydromethanopterin reductase-like flavin-dependent oxidoreductase (luciferase family)
MSNRLAMGSANRLKLGLFGANCSSGRAVTTAEQRWSGNWHGNLVLARMAEDVGIEFMLPIGRWKGYGGDTDYQGTTLETLTWASGLLAKTERLVVFGTVHAPLIHPVIAAKQFVTADHIGEGRVGLNVVCGWNDGEFEMFGVEQRDHEKRYEYAKEWLDAVKAIWARSEEFDFDGNYIQLKKVRAKPKPYNGTRPIIMNAGASTTGQAFAIANCDALFIAPPQGDADDWKRAVREVKTRAQQQRRQIAVYTVGVITCKPTRNAAEDYYRYCILEHADWKAVDNILGLRNITPESCSPEEFQKLRIHQANGLGVLPLVGDPDFVAAELASLSAAGFDGIALSLINLRRRAAVLRRRGIAASISSRVAREALEVRRLKSPLASTLIATNKDVAGRISQVISNSIGDSNHPFREISTLDL